MGDFYGMKPGTIPGFAEAGSGRFISVEGLPRRTVTNMAAFMEKLRRMHQDDPPRLRSVRAAHRFRHRRPAQERRQGRPPGHHLLTRYERHACY